MTEISKTRHVDFYYSASKSNYEYIEKLKNSENITLYEYIVSPSEINLVSGVFNYLKMLFDIFLKRKSYEKIHFIWSVFFLLESLLFLCIRKKLIFTFHNDVPHHYKKKQYLPYKMIQMLASKLVFVSHSTMNKFVKNYGPPPSYQLIQHGIMPLERLAENKEIVAPDVEKVLLFWGKVEAYKGVDLFSHFDVSIPVEILGKWSPQLNPLKDALRNNRNVSIIDRYLAIEELSHLLSRSGVFILPYKNATQSGVLYTLLAYGKVFISSDVGENKEFLLKHGLTDLIFNRDDKASILHAIDYAFEHYDEIHARMLAIREEYRWQHILSDGVVDRLYNTSP